MNNLLKTTVYLILMSLASQLSAQQKIAVVNKDSVLHILSAFYKIDSLTQVCQDSLTTDLQFRMQEMKNYYQEIMLYDSGCFPNPKDSTAFKQQERLINLQKSLQEKALIADKILTQREIELLSPIQSHLDKIIQNIGQGQDYDFIVNSSNNPSILYGQNIPNLDNQILQVFKSTYTHE